MLKSKIGSLLFICCLFNILLSCSQPSSTKETKDDFPKVINANLKLNKKVVLPDSIMALIPCDISNLNQDILAFSFTSGSVFIIDHEGNIKLNFNHMGSGPGEYGEILGLTFLDSSIAILSRTHLIFYDRLLGKFVREIPLKKLDRLIQMNLSFNLPWYVSSDMDTAFVSLRYNWECVDRRQDVKWLNLYNITKDTNHINGKIIDQSIYENEDRLFNEYVPLISVSDDFNYLYMMYEIENQVYRYRLEPRFKLDSIYCFDAKGFDKVYSFQRNISDVKFASEAFKAEQLNGRFYRAISKGSKFFIANSRGLSENLIVDNRAEYMENDLITLREHYLRILDLDNGIKTNEILLVDDENHPLNFCLAASETHIVLKQLRKKDEDEQKNQIFYIGEIVYEE